MRLRKPALLDQLFPGRWRNVRGLLQHWSVYAALMLGGLYAVGSSLRVAHTSDEWILGVGQLGILGLIFMGRRAFFFSNRLEPTSTQDQLAWVQSQPKEVQDTFAQLAHPVHQDAWRELHRFAAGLQSQEAIRAARRKTRLEAVLPAASESTPRARL